MESEEPVRGELGMRPEPIRVDPDDKEEKLDPRSRIDFGKVTTVQHNIKVRSYGKVNDRSMSALQLQFSNVWGAATSVSSPVHPAPSGSSKGNVGSHAPAARRGESTSSGHRSQHARGSEGSRTGKKVTSRSKASAKQDSDDDGDREDRARKEALARQQQRQQQFWAWVDDLEEKGYTRENAIKEISNKLNEKSRSAHKNKEKDDDDHDDHDDEDDEGDDDDEDDDDEE
jgi:hypothetical protein